MGIPGSETALEELLHRLLGDLYVGGHVTKIADDLFCGTDSLEDLLLVWKRDLGALARNTLRLSAKKTTICPKFVTGLCWIWSVGTILRQPSPHRYIGLMRSSCFSVRSALLYPTKSLLGSSQTVHLCYLH